MSGFSYAAAARELAARDLAIARLVDLTGLPRLGPRNGTYFEALVEAITFQQLAGKAAATIHGRLVAVLDGVVTPASLVSRSPEELRGAGLSGNKMASLLDLSAKVLDGSVILEPRAIGRMSDDEVVTRLVAVRGIGVWTAHMFLLFQLRRPDVWPVGDFGVRRGYGLMHGVAMPDARTLAPLGDQYRPYRSVAAWYCWRACDVLG